MSQSSLVKLVLFSSNYRRNLRDTISETVTLLADVVSRKSAGYFDNLGTHCATFENICL